MKGRAYSHELDERVVYARSVGQEEAASWAEVVEEEKFLFFTDLAVVAFRGLGEEDLVVG